MPLRECAPHALRQRAARYATVHAARLICAARCRRESASHTIACRRERAISMPLRMQRDASLRHDARQRQSTRELRAIRLRARYITMRAATRVLATWRVGALRALLRNGKRARLMLIFDTRCRFTIADISILSIF